MFLKSSFTFITHSDRGSLLRSMWKPSVHFLFHLPFKMPQHMWSSVMETVFVQVKRPTWSGAPQSERCPSASLRSCWRWSLAVHLQLQETPTLTSWPSEFTEKLKYSLNLKISQLRTSLREKLHSWPDLFDYSSGGLCRWTSLHVQWSRLIWCNQGHQQTFKKIKVWSQSTSFKNIWTFLLHEQPSFIKDHLSGHETLL